MTTKDIVISWFKGLSGDDRIELMCSLLGYCLPSEIRFIGTYLESSAQKDYYGFRTFESAANNPNDLTYLYPLEDVIVRRRLCLYVALLHSSNRQAAAVLFGILSEFQPSGILDDECLTELSLLYTLAANHPAFSFNQKHILRSRLKYIRMQAVISTSDLGETISDCSTGSSPFFQDAENIESPFSTSPTLEQLETQCDNIDRAPAAKEEEEKNDENLPSPLPENPPKVYVKELKVINIQKKESKHRHESKKKEDHEYIIEVSWSDGGTDKIHKSYEEMFDFQCKLRKMYPTKIDENGQPWKLPFLPGRIRIFNKSEHKGERTPIPDISDYTRLFGSLPIFVRGCDHVLSFFHANTKSKGREKKSKAAKKEEKRNKQEAAKKEMNPGIKDNCVTIEKEKEQCNTSNNNTSTTTSSTTTTRTPALPIIKLSTEKSNKTNEPAKPANSLTNDVHKDKEKALSCVNQIQNKNGLIRVNTTSVSLTSSSLGPTINTAASNQLHSTSLLTTSLHSNPPSLFPGSISIHNHPSMFSSSNSVTVPQTMEALHQHLHVSSLCNSLINHHTSTSNLGWMYYSTSTASLTVQDWLKNLRLHKYSMTFKGKSFNEMLKLTDKELEGLGLTTGARCKLRVNLEILRKRGCFSSDGQKLLDVLPVTTKDFMSCNGYLDGDNDRVFSESDSDCGSDSLSEIYSLVQKPIKPNGCRLSCYNCGSLGHVGGQCMAPNMEKRYSFGYRLRLDSIPQVLQ